MAVPAYHLRTNKAVERFLFIQLLKNIIPLKDCNNYTYCSLGGPYMHDFRLIHENFPRMKMISIEKDADVYKRQKFNLPSGDITLLKDDLSSYLSTFTPVNDSYVFWLDYTALRYSYFEDYKKLLTKLPAGSVIKITFRCEPSAYLNKGHDRKKTNGDYVRDKEIEFKNWFSNVLPGNFTRVPRAQKGFAKLLTKMLKIASQQALPKASKGNIVVPASDFYYRDGAGIYTFTGVIADMDSAADVRQSISHLKYANTGWRKNPKLINIPVLSSKERLHLQADLPCKGGQLQKNLGFKIGANSLEQLKQYAEYYKEYPYFIQGII